MTTSTTAVIVACAIIGILLIILFAMGIKIVPQSNCFVIERLGIS